jgi:repressor of nif and glnA expression
MSIERICREFIYIERCPLLKHGIATYSRFGGLLELGDKKPTRFIEIFTKMERQN